MKRKIYLLFVLVLGFCIKWDPETFEVSFSAGTVSYAQFGDYNIQEESESYAIQSCFNGVICSSFAWKNDDGCTVEYWHTFCRCEDGSYHPDVYQFTTQSTRYDNCTCNGYQRDYFYVDRDGDGYDSGSRNGCSNEPDLTRFTSGRDCNDSNASIRGEEFLYYDYDNDGYTSGSIYTCPGPAYLIRYSRGEDCNDSNARVGGQNWYYRDADGDGYTVGSRQYRCPASGYTATSLGEDCNDRNSSIKGQEWLFRDADNDGYARNNTKFLVCPGSGYIKTSKGIDCDDTKSSIQVKNDCDQCVAEKDKNVSAKKNYHYDGDLDGYHKDGADKKMCQSEYDQLSEDEKKKHILESEGVDCDDTDPVLNEEETWYLDKDGDGYYVDTRESCTHPGPGWNRYSNIGSDFNDNNVFVTTGSCQGDFIIPSLIKDAPDPVTGELSGKYVNIEGSIYLKADVVVLYKGIEYAIDDILYDHLLPEIHLFPNKLIIPSEVPLVGASINTSSGPVVAAISNADANLRTTRGSTDPKRSKWMEDRVSELSGYSHATGAHLLEGNQKLAFYADDFSESHVDQLLSEAVGKLNRSGLTVEIKVYEENEPVEGGVGENERKFTKKHGSGTPDVSMSLLLTQMGTVEFVVSINDAVFVPSSAALAKKGWAPSSELNDALSHVSLNRLTMVQSLGHRYLDYDFSPVAPPSAPEERFDMPAEDYPSYEAGSLSFFEGIIEYVSYSKILITELEVPKGSYDSHNEPEEYNDWKVHSVGSLAGIYDTGLEEIRDLAELMKLAESMFDEKFWNQVLQSLKNFNIADFAQSQLDQIEEFKNDLLGENGKPMQYYRGVYTAIKTIKTAVTIYKSLGKKFLDTFNPDCSDPDLSVTIVDNVDSHINGILPDGLHRSDAFTNLQKADKDRLIEDIASTDNNVLGAELANNPRLVNSWKVLDDAGSDVAKNVDLLKKIDEGGFDLDKVGDLYKNQKAPAGFKGKVDFEATKNIDGVDVTIKYDKEGFPDFRDHSLGEGFSVNSNTLNGTVDDFKAANTTLTNKIGADNIRVLNESGSPVLIKVDGKFEGPFTWHHHQDGKTLMPVKQSVHSSFSHSGGRAVIDRGLQGLFESPY